MDFTGIASITYSAADMAEAKRLFTDWGLTKVSATRTRLVFETATGNRIEVRPDDTPGLPPRLEGGSSFREVVFGVPARGVRHDLGRRERRGHLAELQLLLRQAQVVHCPSRL